MADQQQGFQRPSADPIGTGHDAQDQLAHTDGDLQTPPKVEGISRADANQQQFPSLAGYPGVEVAERSADLGGKATRKHRKIFNVHTGEFGFQGDLFDHVPNFTATRQYMVGHGLRPVGDVSFVGAEPLGEVTTSLTYEVEALPAAVAVDPATAHTVISQD